MFGNYGTTEQGCLSPSSVGKSELDRWEWELPPTSTAASVLLFVTALQALLRSNFFGEKLNFFIN